MNERTMKKDFKKYLNRYNFSLEAVFWIYAGFFITILLSVLSRSIKNILLGNILLVIFSILFIVILYITSDEKIRVEEIIKKLKGGKKHE